MKGYICIIIVIFLTACTNSTKKPLEPPVAALIAEDVSYSQEDMEFEGYLVYGDNIEGKRPGLLLIHHWKGLDRFTKDQADKFARAGYVVFAMDMYGKDVTITSHEEAGKVSGYYRNNRKVMRSRIERAVEVLRGSSLVAEGRLAVAGYCFGGDALIDYMLYKDDFAAGISFHGFYTSPLVGNQLMGGLQIHHGEMDTASTMDTLSSFTEKYPESETYVYEGAGHAYTDPLNDNYDEKAAVVSFERAKSFLKRRMDFKDESEFLDYSIEIEASPEEVFSYIDDPEKNKLWIKGLYEEESLYKEEGTYLNSRFIQRIRSFGMDMEFLGVITSYSVPDYLEMYYSDNRFIIRVDYILEASEKGTLLTQRAYAVESGAFVNFFNRRILKKQIRDLKEVVESASE